MINPLKTYVNPLCGTTVSVVSDYCPIRLVNSNLAKNYERQNESRAEWMHCICSNYEWSLRLMKQIV